MSFHWLFNLLWCRSEIIVNLFSTQVRFNAGNPHLFKVQYNVTLKYLKDQLNEINLGLNPGDTRENGMCLVWTSIVRRGNNNVQSARINEQTTTWGACSRFFVCTTCSCGWICMLRCWDHLKIFSRVWFC